MLCNNGLTINGANLPVIGKQMLSEFDYVYSYRAHVLQMHIFCTWVFRAFKDMQDCGLVRHSCSLTAEFTKQRRVLRVSSRECRQNLIVLLSGQRAGTESGSCHGSRWSRNDGRKSWGRILQNQFCWSDCDFALRSHLHNFFKHIASRQHRPPLTAPDFLQWWQW